MIDETSAWSILEEYVQDCLSIDRHSLLAVYAIGSLSAGYYRPGRSDIDAMLIVQDGSEGIWGSIDEPSPRLAKLNREYLERYKIPKDFGPFPIQEGELMPPYTPERELAEEVARLKLQGRCVFGEVDINSVPMPTPSDFLRDARHFEEWWEEEFVKTTPIGTLSAAGCTNTLLMHLRRFLAIKRGSVEFDKRKIVQAYLDSDPPFSDKHDLELVQTVVTTGRCTSEELDCLREYTSSFRSQMNGYLGVASQSDGARTSGASTTS